MLITFEISKQNDEMVSKHDLGRIQQNHVMFDFATFLSESLGGSSINMTCENVHVHVTKPNQKKKHAN